MIESWELNGYLRWENHDARRLLHEIHWHGCTGLRRRLSIMALLQKFSNGDKDFSINSLLWKQLIKANIISFRPMNCWNRILRQTPGRDKVNRTVVIRVEYVIFLIKSMFMLLLIIALLPRLYINCLSSLPQVHDAY